MSNFPLLENKIQVCVAIDTNDWIKFKTLLFKKGVSVNAAFNEFVKNVADDKYNATRFIDNVATRKARKDVDQYIDVTFKPRKQKRHVPMLADNDKDMIYSLIEHHDDA